VSTAIFLNLSGSVRDTATRQQLVNLKTAATILQNKLPGATVTWTEDGTGIAGIEVFGMPGRFSDHEIVDSIARITGEAAAIYVWDDPNQQFVNLTTTFADAE